MPQKTPAEGGTDGRLASPSQGGQNFRKNVAIFSGTRSFSFAPELRASLWSLSLLRPLD
jgi:hypothetical protein